MLIQGGISSRFLIVLNHILRPDTTFWDLFLLSMISSLLNDRLHKFKQIIILTNKFSEFSVRLNYIEVILKNPMIYEIFCWLRFTKSSLDTCLENKFA